jgi:hypothetical protein
MSIRRRKTKKWSHYLSGKNSKGRTRTGICYKTVFSSGMSLLKFSYANYNCESSSGKENWSSSRSNW